MRVNGFGFDLTAATDIGPRKENQDSYSTYFSEDGRFFMAAVCDGMGGLKDGKKASGIAADGLAEWAAKVPHEDAEELCIAFVDELDRLEERLIAEAPGSGTTVSAVICLDGQWISLHLGDSRCYTLKDGRMFRTLDQSPVEKMLQAGLIDEEEALTHPMSNVVSRYLGGRFAAETDVETLEDWDVLALCSDGAFGYMLPADFRELLASEDAEGIVRKAVERGGKDNATVIRLTKS